MKARPCRWSPASGPPSPEGWPLSCRPRLSGFICWLLQTFTVCSPILTSEVVTVLIFMVEEVLVHVWVMSGKGARPTVYLTNYSGAPSFHQVTDRVHPSLSRSMYNLPGPLSGLQDRGRGLW